MFSDPLNGTDFMALNLDMCGAFESDSAVAAKTFAVEDRSINSVQACLDRNDVRSNSG